MEKLTTLTGVAVPLRRSNVDTDQITEFDKALKELQEDGTIKKLEDKWLNV